MKYNVVLSRIALKQLKHIDRKQAERILVQVYSLAADPWPNASTLLRGSDAYRLRVGDYRVIYEVNKHEIRVFVIRIQHRREVYRKL